MWSCDQSTTNGSKQCRHGNIHNFRMESILIYYKMERLFLSSPRLWAERGKWAELWLRPVSVTQCPLQHTFRAVLTELAWPSMLVIMSSTFLVTVTVMTGSDLGLSWVWPPTWSPGRLRSRMVTVHLPSSNPREAFQKKKFHLLKRLFLTKQVRCFFVKLRKGGGHLSHFFLRLP